MKFDLRNKIAFRVLSEFFYASNDFKIQVLSSNYLSLKIKLVKKISNFNNFYYFYVHQITLKFNQQLFMFKDKNC